MLKMISETYLKCFLQLRGYDSVNAEPFMCTVKHRNSPQTLVSNQSQAALGSGPDVAWALSYHSAKGSCELGTKAVLESHTPHRCAPQKSSIHRMLDYELTSGHWSFRSLWPLQHVCNSRTPFCRDHSPWFKKLEIKALNYDHLVLTKEIKHTLCVYNLFIKWCWEDFVHKEENETRALSLTQCENQLNTDQESLLQGLNLLGEIPQGMDIDIDFLERSLVAQEI